MTKDRDTIITTGVGQHQMWAAQYYQVPPARGVGFPAAGWARWASACPRRWAPRPPIPIALVVDIDGDGSLLMNIQEMATCYCEKLPVKVLLLNNMHLGMVVQWEDRFHAANRAHTYLGPIDHPEAIGPGRRHHARASAIPTSWRSPRVFTGAPGTCAQKAELTRRPRRR